MKSTQRHRNYQQDKKSKEEKAKHYWKRFKSILTKRQSQREAAGEVAEVILDVKDDNS